MTFLKSSLRRSAIVLAGAVIGLGGAAAVAAPASAHDATVSVKSICNAGTGKHDITWTLTNDWGTDATVQNLKLAPGDAPVDADSKPLENGYVLPMQSGKNYGVATFEQSLPGDVKSASVSFDAVWSDYVDHDNAASIDLGGPCAAPAEECVTSDNAKFHHDFAVENGKSTAEVTLDKGLDLCKGEPVTLVSYYAPRPQFSFPQYQYDFDTDTITTDHPVADPEVDVPDCNTQVDLFFGSKDEIIKEITEHGPRYNDKKLGSQHGLGSRSQGKLGAYNGGQKACQNPDVQPLSQCDGTLTLKFSNSGKNAAYPIQFTVKGSGFEQDGHRPQPARARRWTSRPASVRSGGQRRRPAGPDHRVGAAGRLRTAHQWSSRTTCDTVTITVQNPKDVAPATAKITYGDQSKTLTVAAGKSGTATFKTGHGQVRDRRLPEPGRQADQGHAERPSTAAAPAAATPAWACRSPARPRAPSPAGRRSC